MEIVIKETGEKEELSVWNNGIEWTTDLMGNAGMHPWNQQNDQYEMNQEDFDWWKKYIDNYNADEKAIEELADELGISTSDINMRIQMEMNCDMEDEHQAKQDILKSIKEEKETFVEMIRDWKSDNAEEMEDLEIDEFEMDENAGKWVAYAHDEKTSYSLTDDGAGNIAINYLGSRQ